MIARVGTAAAVPDAGVVTRWGPPPGWSPLRSLDVLADTGVSAAYLGVFVAVRRLVVGRRIRVRAGDGTLLLVVDDVVARLRGPGPWHDVRVTARDVRFDEHRLATATATLHDVRLRAGVPPVLVAAPVELSIDVPAPTLERLVSRAAPRLVGRLDRRGVATVHVARRQAAGHVEVDVRLDGDTLWVVPRALVRRRRWPLPARTPGYPIRLPRLPTGMRIVAVELRPDAVRIVGELDEWRMELQPL